MLSDARRNIIKSIAVRDGEVIISKVSAELGVSLETVRRDINALCKENVLEKVHGGAIPVKVTTYEDEYSKRKIANADIKRKLGDFAVKKFGNVKVIMLSSGTTMEAVADSKEIPENLTVVTNSISVAETFGKSKKENIILIGGTLNKPERFTFGAETKSEISKYRADVAFISAVGIDENGAMCSNSEEGGIISEIIKSSAKTILIADSNKLGVKSVWRYCTLDEIDEIVTDSKKPIQEKLKKAFKNHNVKMNIV